VTKYFVQSIKRV